MSETTETKTVELQNGDISAVLEGLAGLSKVKIPVTKALLVKSTVRVLENQAKDVDAVRNDLITQHAEKDEHGEPVQADDRGNVKLKDFKAFAKDYNDLLTTTFSVAPIYLSWFGKTVEDLEKLDVETDTFIKLGDLLVDDVT